MWEGGLSPSQLLPVSELGGPNGLPWNPMAGFSGSLFLIKGFMSCLSISAGAAQRSQHQRAWTATTQLGENDGPRRKTPAGRQRQNPAHARYKEPIDVRGTIAQGQSLRVENEPSCSLGAQSSAAQAPKLFNDSEGAFPMSPPTTQPACSAGSWPLSALAQVRVEWWLLPCRQCVSRTKLVGNPGVGWGRVG